MQHHPYPPPCSQLPNRLSTLSLPGHPLLNLGQEFQPPPPLVGRLFLVIPPVYLFGDGRLRNEVCLCLDAFQYLLWAPGVAGVVG